jgi:Mn-containing catalase
MYHHVKKLMYTVRVDTPDPKFGNMLLVARFNQFERI